MNDRLNLEPDQWPENRTLGTTNAPRTSVPNAQNDVRTEIDPFAKRSVQGLIGSTRVGLS